MIDLSRALPRCDLGGLIGGVGIEDLGGGRESGIFELFAALFAILDDLSELSEFFLLWLE